MPNGLKRKNKDYVSILQWIVGEGIVSEKGEPLDFYDHPFLLDILTDWSPRIACAACAQVGKSVTFSLKTLFAVKYLKFNVIYTFPTDADVQEFVSSKFNKILQMNSAEFVGMDTDSIERKEINDRFIFFKGTVSKTAAISNSADLLVHDESSRSNQLTLGTYRSRTKDSPYKGNWKFSNPTTEKDALDQDLQKSDQKEWHVTCPHCKIEHQMSWPLSINIQKRCFQCAECKQPIDDEVRRRGRWIDKNGKPWDGKPLPLDQISGWHLSHLMATKITAGEIIDDSEGDQEYFHNFVLGLPYNPGDLSVSKSTILDIWTPRDIRTTNYYLGVDVGNIKHYTLWSDKGIVKVGKFTRQQDLDDIISFYRPAAGVIDAMPDNTWSKYIVDKYPQIQMSFFQENAINPQALVWYGEDKKKGIVYSSRDRVIDKMLTDMIEAKFLIGVESNKDLLEYIKHFETLRRVKVTNNAGIERYVWESTTGVDHYVFATLYGWIARQSAASGVFYGETGPSDEEKPSVLGADNVYDVSRMFSDNNSEQSQ